MKESFYFLFFLHVLQLVNGARIMGFNFKLATANNLRAASKKVSKAL